MSSSVNQLYEILISIRDETEYNEHKDELFRLLNAIKREIRFENITKEDINKVDPKMTKILMDSVRGMDMDEDKQNNINTIHRLWLKQKIPMPDFFKRLDGESYARTSTSSSRKSPTKMTALNKRNLHDAWSMRTTTDAHPFARGKRSRKCRKGRKGKKCRKSRKSRRR